MNLVEVRFQCATHSWTDWVPEAEVDNQIAQAKAAGVTATIIGKVSWQRQLAQMENPPL